MNKWGILHERFGLVTESALGEEETITFNSEAEGRTYLANCGLTNDTNFDVVRLEE